ncbi:MAG: KpsF/GutQ family sugar-phosphate isomerase [Proteobacteria bacterium]|nr:KpsF/GutQ family sugar-phosphate isomerase [Pseudomonadota bacterium]
MANTIVNNDTADWQKIATQVLEIESNAVLSMQAALNDSFIQAVKCIAQTRGKVVCSGVGKSGHIASKIAATLSSTGTAAFFMHANEAGHGDLGMIGEGDIVLLLSYSGESSELLKIVPVLKRLQVPLITIVGNADSTLAQTADICLLATVEQEACPHNLAPTASTTAALALGDALAMTILAARGFSPDDFARTHPLGKLGRRLLLRVEDTMRTGENIPLVHENTPFAETLLEITSKRMGMTLVNNAADELCGIITDGDLRRALLEKKIDLQQQTAGTLMTPQPTTAPPEMLAVTAVQLMKEKALNHLAVIQQQKLVGALSFHDLLRHRIL